MRSKSRARRDIIERIITKKFCENYYINFFVIKTQQLLNYYK